MFIGQEPHASEFVGSVKTGCCVIIGQYVFAVVVADVLLTFYHLLFFFLLRR